MAGRDVSVPATPVDGPGSRRIAVSALGVVAVFGLGIAIGSRIASPSDSTTVVTATVGTRAASAPRAAPRVSRQTTAGAVEAAARSITAFDGDVLLDPVRLDMIVGRLASDSSRARLTTAFNQASAQTRAKLGVDTVPRPLVVLRAIPVGYRVDRYAQDSATVAVWYVGIVGSGATVEPQQSWRTQVVSLVWERGDWRVVSFASSPGPTPPLPATETAQPSGDLFTTIPSFEEFRRAQP